MTGEECKFLHPAPCRKYMEIPESSCRAQCKGYHPELCKYSRATRECYNDRCFRIHLKGTRHTQTPPSTQVPSTTHRTTNQQEAMITTQNPVYNRPPPLLTLQTQHDTATHPAPSPTHYHTSTPTQYLTTPQTTVPLYVNLLPLHAIPYATSSSSTPTQSLHPPQTSALAPQTHYPSFSPNPHLNPTPHTSMPRMGTSEQHKGAQLRMTIIFFYGK